MTTTTQNSEPKTGTAIRVHGLTCDNPKCAMYHGLVFCGLLCVQCGYKLKPASVVATSLRLEN